MNSSSNRIQIFSELVGLQAWHLPFTTKRTSVGLHADVTFSTARLGVEEACPVRFRVMLKRAMLSVEVPETEPVVIDPASVSRERNGTTSGVRMRKQVTKASGGIGGELSAKLNASQSSGSLGLSAKASSSVESVEEFQSTTKVTSILFSHSTDERGIQRWTFEPGMGSFLQGKPWSAADYPLARIKDTRGPHSKSIEPSIRFSLSCLREDLHIYDIVCKDKGILNRFGKLPATKLIAAEAFIRNRIEQVGLAAPDMSEGFAHITLARTTSGEGGW